MWIRQFAEELPPSLDPLLILWCHYHVMAEDFDRTLPGRWSQRDADTWEVDPRYIGESRRHARDLVVRMGLSDAREARKAAARMRHHQHQEIASRYPIREIVPSWDGQRRGSFEV